ncbi:ethionine resistance protein [Microbotryomycetes sp. JL221]|nr:ethionine resistance protein [Microbotryomycetes sp. JL221]
MFSGYPGTSPASYNGDVSFLQRAAVRGDKTLHGSSGAAAATNSSTTTSDDEADHEQPFVNTTRTYGTRRNNRRMSASFSITSSSRLSPTRESSDAEDDQDDDDNEHGQDDARDEHARLIKTTNLTIDGDDAMTRPMLGDEPSLGVAQVAHSKGNAVPVVGGPPGGFGSTHLDNETTPLLPNARVPKQDSTDRRAAYMHEMKVLIGYSIPIAGTHYLEYSLLVVTVVSLGHLGTVELAAASISNMTSNVVALSIIQGFCTALDTLCPQAYTSKRKDTSLYALRTAVLLVLLAIPQTIFLWNGERILLLLRQDPRVAERAGLYLKVMSFGMPSYGGFECIRRWLQAQGLMVAPVITLAVAAPLNVILNYLLVWGPEPIRLGFVGAPIASALSMFIMFITSVLYAVWFAPRDAWGGFSKEVFKDLGLNFRLGLAGTAMVASEWWCWEVVGLASSFLGPTALAAQSVLLTSASLFYQVPYSLSVAAAVRVGNLLGAQRPKTAQVASRATLFLAVVIAGINSILLVLFRHQWGRLFASETEVVKAVASVLPLVATFQLTDGLSGACGGLLRGAGKATLGAAINLTSYYVLGLPLGLGLTFLGPKMGLRGLWLGLTLALTATAIFSTYFVWLMNWEQECKRALVRMGVMKTDEEDRAQESQEESQDMI